MDYRYLPNRLMHTRSRSGILETYAHDQRRLPTQQRLPRVQRQWSPGGVARNDVYHYGYNKDGNLLTKPDTLGSAPLHYDAAQPHAVSQIGNGIKWGYSTGCRSPKEQSWIFVGTDVLAPIPVVHTTTTTQLRLNQTAGQHYERIEKNGTETHRYTLYAYGQAVAVRKFAANDPRVDDPSVDGTLHHLHSDHRGVCSRRIR